MGRTSAELMVGILLGEPLEQLVEDAFRGPLAAAGLQVREQQVEMGRAVARAIDAGTDLVVEAATGSGKGLGYLVPGVLAVIRNRKRGEKARVVVSTANIALQRQLVDKDVPQLAAALGVEISAAQLKGRSNWACLDRVDSERVVQSPGDPHRLAVSRITDWLDSGGSGDKEDVPFGVLPAAWGRVSVGSDECLGISCPHNLSCLANQARNRAMAAGVLVVNHAYLVRAWAGLVKGTTLLVADEGHELADNVRRGWAAEVRTSAANHWGKVVERASGEVGLGHRVRDAVNGAFADAVAAKGPTGRQFRLRPGWCASLDHATAEIGEGAAAVRRSADMARDADPVAAARLEKQADGLDGLARKLRIAACADPVGTGRVAWIEVERDRMTLCASPVDGGIPDAPGVPVVVTSATLAVAGRVDAAAAELGIPGAEKLVLPSPWPVAEMAVAVVPELPVGAPRDLWADERAVEFCRMMGGGVLVLAASYARMHQLADALDAELPWAVRRQGEAGRSELVAWFAADEDGILVGTRSLFQGIDVAGRACRGVVIDKVPFPSPGDPLEEGICELMTSKGGNPFRDRSLVVACAAVRQGAGRLLRSPADRGAVLLLDGRLHDASWRRTVLRSLSPMPVSTSVADARRVLDGLSAIGPMVEVGPPATQTGRPARRSA